MKREALITVLIVIVILIGEWVTQKYTKKTLSNVQTELIELKEEILKADTDVSNLIQKSEEINENWENKNQVLSFYLEHDELEKVNTQIILIKGYLESDTPQDSIPDLEEGVYILEHIKVKEAFTLKNIL